MSKINKSKAGKLIAKGDRLKDKGKFKKALENYTKAKKYDPTIPELYDRLIEAHEKSTEKWDEKDVADSVGWAMEKQEIENPAIKLLHERLTPEWAAITEKISALIICGSEEEEIKIINDIKEFGEEAIYPLIYTLLQIKKGATEGNGCETKKGE